jgi:hypothetical protein
VLMPSKGFVKGVVLLDLVKRELDINLLIMIIFLKRLKIIIRFLLSIPCFLSHRYYWILYFTCSQLVTS